MMLFILAFLPIVQSMDKIKENDTDISLLPPDLAYDPISHDFGFVEEGDTYQTEFFIWNLGTGTLDWNLGIVNPWLSPNPTSGSSIVGKNEITVTIDTTGLAIGSYSGSISIFANDGGGTRFYDVDFYVDTPPDTPSIPSGETAGLIDEEYSYYTSSNDDDFDWIAYRFDFGNRLTDWTMYTAPGIGNSADNIWSVAGTYQVKAQAKDLHGSTSDWSSPLVVVISSGGNNPPDKPSTPSGTSNGKAGTSYTYSSNSHDIDGDQLYYLFDWGDGNDSGWKGPYNSGDIISESHIWDIQGTYPIKVKAKDLYDEESVWSDSLSVSMPKSINNFYPWLFRLIQRFPIFEYLL
jgi:hypothetical protein